LSREGPAVLAVPDRTPKVVSNPCSDCLFKTETTALDRKTADKIRRLAVVFFAVGWPSGMSESDASEQEGLRLPSRSTRGKRMKLLVGEEAEKDALYWQAASKIFEDVSDDDSYATESGMKVAMHAI